ncbi:hypothetical protein RDWZM_000062 [Blomia tropicalis]|uniref:Peptidase M14 domain-containing protein n=1 Tax=Blomia tropicalis TaxID=40697 RepID=A0A9Q0MBI3_BLOTA|nr:hypothetical protein RDWZM_000062 [Blomia tropicalis]
MIFNTSTNNNDDNLTSISNETKPLPPTPPILDFRHHHNQELFNLIVKYAESYPHIARHYTIGNSTEGYPLMVIEISDNPGQHEPGEPEMKLVGNIHGNEVVGRELLLYLIDFLLKNYERNQAVRSLVNNVRLHILPSLNPDGYAIANMGDCDGVIGRANANQIDLNRNFPDQFASAQMDPLELETQSIINWTKSIPFVLSLSLHGGALVVNYPFDTNLKSINRYTSCPDDETFRYLALLYSKTHPQMPLGNCTDSCASFEYNEHFKDGITNGAAWYPITGGMQDWNYINANCFELTIELGCSKYPLSKNLKQYWDNNLDSIIKLINAVHIGVSGFVIDSNGSPIEGAIISVVGIDKNVTTHKMGDYWRLLTPNKRYTVTASKDGFHSSTYNIELDQIGQYKLNFTLILE